MSLSINKEDKVSSYPGIYKFPKNRDVFQPQTPFEWMEEKRRLDDIGENHWRVHDKIYDLRPFIDTHPGGPDWLNLSNGTDVTEAFESHHVLNYSYVEKVLAKYYVKDAESKRNSPYTFNEDGFYKTLKKRAAPILRSTVKLTDPSKRYVMLFLKLKSGPSPKATRIIDSLAVGFAVTAILGVYFFSIPLMAISALLLTMTSISGHNFCHMRDNWRKYYFDFTTLSSYEWRISHMLSHHQFPNTVLDAEMSYIEPIMDFRATEKHWFITKIALLSTIGLYGNIYWGELAKRVFWFMKGKQQLRPENFIPFTYLAVFMMITDTYWYAIFCWGFIITLASYIFGIIALNAAHHHPDIFHDGDETRKDPDYGLCQLITIREKSDSIFENSVFMLSTFGEHYLHHMFPTTCHTKLDAVQEVFEQTLADFGESIPAKISQWEHIKGTIQQLERTKPKTIEEQLEAEKKLKEKVKSL